MIIFDWWAKWELTKCYFESRKQKPWLADKAFAGWRYEKLMWVWCPSVTKRLKPLWAWKVFWAGSDEHSCEYNGLQGQEKACVGMRGVCGLEAWKIQAGKTTFVVKRIKVYVGLEGLCEPDESTLLPCTGTYGTRSMGEREPTYIYIYIYILKKLTLYIIFLLRPTQPRCLELSTIHQRRRNKNVI